MHFTGTIYRNPYWPTWPLLEITQGCTHNRCKFCTMYKEVPFRMSPMEWIEEDLKELAARVGIHPVHLYKIKAGQVPLSARMQERLVDLLTQRYQTYSTEEAYLSLLRRLGVDLGTGEGDE